MTESWERTPDELGALIAAEKGRPDPSPEAQSRVLARLASTLALPTPTAPAGPQTPLPRPGGGTLGRVSRHVSRRALATFLVGAAAGGAAVGTVDRIQGRSTMPAPAVLPAPSAEPPIPMPEPPPPPEAPLPAPVPPSVVVRVPGAPAIAGRDKRLEAERKLIEMARTALARGQTDGALATLHRHQRQFPQGELAEERDSLWVAVLVARGDHEQARALGLRFRAHYPHSLFGPSVDQALKSIP